MSLENTQAKYEIAVTKTGTGAADTARELKQLEVQAVATGAAFKNANVHVAAASPHYEGLHQASKGLKAGLHEMEVLVSLLGAELFPQMTSAIMVAQVSMHSVRAAAIATGIGLAGTATAFAGLATGVYAVVQSFEALHAAEKETQSGEALDQTMAALAKRNADILRKAIAEERVNLDNATIDAINTIVESPTPGGIKALQAKVKEVIPPDYLLSDAAKAKTVTDLNQAQERHIELTNLEVGVLKTREAKELEINEDYKARIALYQQEYDRGLINQKELSTLDDEAQIKKLRGIQQIEKKLTELQELEKKLEEDFAKGLAGAIVEAASGAKKADEAFKEFALNFLKEVAQMILQMEILNALKAMGLGTAASGTVKLAAAGAVRYAASGIAGVSTLSSATYLPRFNTIAAEAGPEMLTVLARPRLMDVGGIEAVVGNAGPNRLAITAAKDLAQRGNAGGHILIEIRHSDEAKAKIVEQAIQGAEIRVTQNVQRNTPLRHAVKRANV